MPVNQNSTIVFKPPFFLRTFSNHIKRPATPSGHGAGR